MEQYLRLALWMFLFIGYLQAKPFNSTTCNAERKTYVMGDLGFELHDAVRFDARENFTSPTNVQKHCYHAALKCFQDGLTRAANISIAGNITILRTLEALKQNTVINECVNTTECQWEKSKKSFEGFVGDMKTFVEQVNSGNMGK